MNKYACNNPDCTVAVTGKCVLSRLPVETCEHVSVLTDLVTSEIEASSIEVGSGVTVFHGNELGWQQAATIFASRYGRLIGILGEAGTGKTCILSCLYLLASCGELRPDYMFAGSRTLPGFEGRIRNLRQWKGPGLPDQIVDHTYLADERQPGLLHLALKRASGSSSPVDLLLTDLPGEWTTALVRRADKAERLAFLRRADSIVIAVSAPALASDETRNSQIQFVRLLLQRFRDTLEIDTGVPIIFALTRCDTAGATAPSAIYKIIEAAETFGFLRVSFCMVAAFSDRSDIPSGMGVTELVSSWLDAHDPTYPPRNSSRPPQKRMFARFTVD